MFLMDPCEEGGPLLPLITSFLERNEDRLVFQEDVLGQRVISQRCDCVPIGWLCGSLEGLAWPGRVPR